MSTTIRELTCIVCPRGCQLRIELEDQKVVGVSGNMCKRGVAYAEAECTCPTRTVTTTVRCESGKVVSVKTSAPVPKSKVFDVMKEINSITAPNGVKIGDVIIKGVAGTDSDVVATSNF